MKKMQKHYHLYIDDHGSRYPDHVMSARDDGMDCFALGGILVLELDIPQIVERHKEFCESWEINYPLHSTDIRGMRGNFRWLQNSTKKSKRFHEELNDYLTSIPVIGFAVAVNRPGYNARYKERYGDYRWKLCKTAYTILMERVGKFIMDQDATFEVFFEQSGKKEDRDIKGYARTLKVDGQPFNPKTSAEYTPFSAESFKRLMLGEPRERTKKCYLTQIADVYLYPMVKRKYDPVYRPWIALYEAGRIVDAILEEEERGMRGIKYSCFDEETEEKAKTSE